MTVALLTPSVVDLARKDGQFWRRQLLPVGKFNYTDKHGNKRILDFTRDYLAGLVRSFKDKAYDGVGFLLAPPDNSHTMDPTRLRGEVHDLQMTGNGLDVVMSLSPDAERLVEEYPNVLGVSARIVEGIERADGKKFPAAIEHVLGTISPRMTGMASWQAVNLATADDLEVIDMTDATLIEKESTVADTLTADQIKEGLAALSDDDRKALLAEHTPPAEPPKTEPTTPEGEPELTAEEQAQVDALIEQLTADADADLEPTSLSEQDRAAIDLAHSQAREALDENARIRGDLARSKWATEKQALLAAGVPKVILDLAEPVLALPDAAVIDLSETEKVDATDVIRKMTEACKGTVDLAVHGSAEAPDEDTTLLDAWEAQYPAKRS